TVAVNSAHAVQRQADPQLAGDGPRPVRAGPGLCLGRSRVLPRPVSSAACCVAGRPAAPGGPKAEPDATRSAMRSTDTSSSPCPLRGRYSSAPRGVVEATMNSPLKRCSQRQAHLRPQPHQVTTTSRAAPAAIFTPVRRRAQRYRGLTWLLGRSPAVPCHRRPGRLGFGAMSDNEADLSSPSGSASQDPGVNVWRVADRLSEAECMELLANGGVGRLVFTSRYGPTALPTVYRIDS